MKRLLGQLRAKLTGRRGDVVPRTSSRRPKEATGHRQDWQRSRAGAVQGVSPPDVDVPWRLGLQRFFCAAISTDGFDRTASGRIVEAHLSLERSCSVRDAQSRREGEKREFAITRRDAVSIRHLSLRRTVE